jgi:hypothetical protein
MAGSFYDIGFSLQEGTELGMSFPSLQLVTYVVDFLCHFLAFPFRLSAQSMPLFAH